MNKINAYASLVKFSHTLFALPFALVGYTWAITTTANSFSWPLLVKVLLCMLFARNAAMAFNRWSDRDTDAQNPRTASREIPRGEIKSSHALLFIIVNVVLFISCTALINPLSLYLSPIALIILLGYSLTKRFTSLSHIVLGVALGIAPVGAYIAVTGTIDSLLPLLLSALVASWVSGFDIIYSLQDREFDRGHGLHSIPASFSIRGALIISLLLHLLTIYCVAIIGLLYDMSWIYWSGATIFTLLTIYQHIEARPSQLERIGAMFGLVNGASSLLYGGFIIAEILIRF